jgi:flavin-dependent dehydrogenase
VRRVEQDGEAVVVDGLRARYLVAADGLHSPVRRSLGLDGTAPTVARRRYGLRAHVARPPWSPYVEVHWAADAEAYVTPVGDELVGVAVLTSRPRPYDELLAAFPALGERLAAGALSRVRGAGPLRQRSRRRVEGRVLLVGDAAGYVDALTGEGIALGLDQAQAAVAAVVAEDPGAYAAHWRTSTAAHRRLTGALVTATQVPVARRLLVPAAARLPRVFETIVAGLAAPASAVPPSPLREVAVP